MTTKTKNPFRALRRVASVWLAGLAWFVASAAAAQPSKKPSPPPSPSAPAPTAKAASTPDAKAAGREAVTEVFNLKYAKAAGMAQLLGRVLDGSAEKIGPFSINADERLNALVIRGTPEAARMVADLLQRFDQPPPRGLLMETMSVKVFELQHAKAGDMVKMVTAVLDDKSVRLIADPRTNTVLFSGPYEPRLVVEALIHRLDEPVASEPAEHESQVRIYPLKHADASMVLSVVQTMLAGHPTIRIALDQKTNSVVMAGSDKDLNTAAELIKTLDVTSPSRQNAKLPACQFRIVWLASGLSSKDAPAPADELKPVVEQLSDLGVKDVRQVGAMVVNTLAEGQFHMRCSPLFEGAPAELTVEGKLDAKTEPMQLSLRIAAKQRRPITVGVAAPPDAAGGFAGDTVNLVNLDTMISPRFDGSYVVLGAAPVGKVTSIFVVQTTQRTER